MLLLMIEQTPCQVLVYMFSLHTLLIVFVLVQIHVVIYGKSAFVSHLMWLSRICDFLILCSIWCMHIKVPMHVITCGCENVII